MDTIFILVIAFILDCIFGDPQSLPHPICLIGNLIKNGETFYRKHVKNEFIGGMMLTITVVMLSFLVPFFIISLAGKINGYLAFAINIVFSYQILAAKSLKKESMKVYYPLKSGNLPEARKFLSWIVGRDTGDLDEIGVTKATVETVAENTTDGVVAPMIFIALGGAPLGFMYKAINTLDSMIGYKNDKYMHFGRFAARLDDVANFIPARITAIFMIIASGFVGLDFKNAFKIYIRDHRNHKSPNSAQTESVCAGALNVQLAGDAYYFGKLTKKPTIGDKNREIEPEDIIRANKLMYETVIITLIVTVIIGKAI